MFGGRIDLKDLETRHLTEGSTVRMDENLKNLKLKSEALFTQIAIALGESKNLIFEYEDIHSQMDEIMESEIGCQNGCQYLLQQKASGD